MKLIGMVHLKTLPGYPNHKKMEFVIDQAIEDAKILEQGGVDSILIENTEDDPHKKINGPETIAAMTAVIKEIIKNIKIPVGLCVLWNDYKAALAIAKVVGATFIRVPVFTEAVLTSSGIIEGDPYDVINYRNTLNANEIKILADIHVKHAAMVAKRPIEESAIEASGFGADELIITGKFTGDTPDIEELRKTREKCKEVIINIGSGTDIDNIDLLAKYADNFIVGTYFKDSEGKISLEKVKKLRQKINELIISRKI